MAEKLPRTEPNLKLSPLFQANILQRSAQAQAQASTSRESSSQWPSPLAASVTKFLKCHDCPDRPFTSLEELERHVVGVHGKLYVSFMRIFFDLIKN